MRESDEVAHARASRGDRSTTGSAGEARDHGAAGSETGSLSGQSITAEYMSPLSEADVARVLRRAVELDQKRGSAVGVDELRQIAVEAGISMESLDRALEEVRLARLDESAPAERASDAAARPVDAGNDGGAQSLRARIIDLLHSAGLITAGGVLGIVGHMSNRGQLGVATLLLAVALGLETVRRHARTGARLRFQIDNVWLWASYVAGSLMAAPYLRPGTWAWLLLAWSGFAVFGGRVVAGAAGRTKGFFRSMFGRREQTGTA